MLSYFVFGNRRVVMGIGSLGLWICYIGRCVVVIGLNFCKYKLKLSIIK